MIRGMGLCRRTAAVLCPPGHVALRTCRITLRARCSASRSSAASAASPSVAEPGPSALCVAVVDAFEFESASAAVAKQVQGAGAVVLAITGSDRLPHLGPGEIQYLRRRFERQGGRCAAVVAMPSTDGESLTSLSAEVLSQADRIRAQHILVSGMPDADHRALMLGLPGEMQRLREANEDAAIAAVVPDVAGVDVEVPALWSRRLWGRGEGSKGEVGEASEVRLPSVEVGEWMEIPPGEELRVEYMGRPVAGGDGGSGGRSGGRGSDGLAVGAGSEMDVASADGSSSGGAAAGWIGSVLCRVQIDRAAAEEEGARSSPMVARLFAPAGVGLKLTPHGKGGAGDLGGGGREGGCGRGAWDGGTAKGAGREVLGNKEEDEGFDLDAFGSGLVDAAARALAREAGGPARLARRRPIASDHFKFMGGHAIEIAMPGIGWLTLCHSEPFRVRTHAPPEAELISRRPMYSRTFTPAKARVLYPEHLPADQLRTGAADLVLGKLIVTFSNPTCGFVPLDSSAGPNSRSIAVKGREAMNRAMHGDQVALRVVKGRGEMGAEGEGGAAPEAAAVEGAAVEGAAEERAGDGTDNFGGIVGAASATVALSEAPAEAWDGDGAQVARQAAPSAAFGVGTEPAPAPAVPPTGTRGSARVTSGEGVVVGILERVERRLVVLFESIQRASAVPMVATPRDARYPRVQLSPSPGRTTPPPASMQGQLLVARVTGWAPDQQLPSAELLRVLGEAGSLEAETEAYLIENNVAVEPFSPEVLACLPPADFTIPQAEIDRRVDLRNGPARVYSIDPPGCVDIDDALHLRSLSEGLYEVCASLPTRPHSLLLCQYPPQSPTTPPSQLLLTNPSLPLSPPLGRHPHRRRDPLRPPGHPPRRRVGPPRRDLLPRQPESKHGAGASVREPVLTPPKRGPARLLGHPKHGRGGTGALVSV